LLAGAFGVGLDVIITNSPETAEISPAEDAQPYVPRVPRNPVEERMVALERGMVELLEVLGDLGIRGLPSFGGQTQVE